MDEADGHMKVQNTSCVVVRLFSSVHCIQVVPRKCFYAKDVERQSSERSLRNMADRQTY